MGGDRLHPPRPARGGLPAGVRQTPLPVHRVRLLHVGGLPARLLRAARRDRVRGRALARPTLATRRAGGRDAPDRHAAAGRHRGPGSRGRRDDRRALPQARHRASAPVRARCRRCPSRGGRGTVVNALTLSELVDTLVAARRAGGFRYEHQARVLAQFVEHCRREGYADGSIIQEAVEGFLYGRHLKASTIRREEIILRDLAEHARQFGWPAWTPPTLTRLKARHRPPPYVFSDEEIRRLFHAIDTQPLSEMSNRALVDPVLFRVLYATGLRISEALNLQLRDLDAARATLGVRDSKNRESRIVPVTRRLADTLESYIAAAHPHPEPAHHLFHTGDPAKPADKSTIYNRLRRYLADADIPHFSPSGPHIH